jgi:hypothetical protein
METIRARGAQERAVALAAQPTSPASWLNWLALALFWAVIILSPLLYDLAQRAPGA